MKPKDIFIITTHSFVDLITNSSSELFVCDGKKTVEAVKEILVAMLKMHDTMMNESHSFEGVFGDIEISKFGLDYWKVPQDIRAEYEKYKEYGNPFYRTSHYYDSNNRPAEYDELTEKEREIDIRIGVDEKDLYKKDKDEYDRRWKQSRIEADALWTDYGIRQHKTELAFFREFLKQNEFDDAALARFDEAIKLEIEKARQEKRGRYLRIEMPTEFNEDWNVFDLWEGYGIQAKKGAIIVHSASDNTIPYELMESLSAYLGASRYHIG